MGWGASKNTSVHSSARAFIWHHFWWYNFGCTDFAVPVYLRLFWSLLVHCFSLHPLSLLVTSLLCLWRFSVFFLSCSPLLAGPYDIAYSATLNPHAGTQVQAEPERGHEARVAGNCRDASWYFCKPPGNPSSVKTSNQQLVC